LIQLKCQRGRADESSKPQGSAAGGLRFLEWRYQGNALIDRIVAVLSAIRQFGPPTWQPITLHLMARWQWRPRTMKQKRNRPTRRPRRVLRLPDLEHARTAVLNSLSSPESQRGYRYAIDEFVDWYCSEPRLAFNRIVVLRYRSHLESRRLAPGTINLRLGAVRRLAYEAADCGLLSSDLAAGIRRVKGLKKNGVRMGNWLTDDQARSLWQSPDDAQMKGRHDRALLALLLACGLRRHEAASLRVEDLQQREEHCAIVDLVGKGRHIRTVPMPDWVHMELLGWLRSGSIDRGKVFRRVSRTGRVLGDGISEKAIWHVVRSSA
jgi:site-specific recombinase XerD